MFIYEKTIKQQRVYYQNDKVGNPKSRMARNKNMLSYTASAVKNFEKRSLEFPLTLGFIKTNMDMNVPITPKTETDVKTTPSTIKTKLSTGTSFRSSM